MIDLAAGIVAVVIVAVAAVLFAIAAWYMLVMVLGVLSRVFHL